MSAEDATHMGEYLGIELLDAAPEAALARLEVSDRVRQPYGIVHGGAYATLAETLCSWATFEAVRDDGMVALGQSNSASFIRPISQGSITAAATARHRGRTIWIWDCEISDDSGRLCALVRITVAVRPAASVA